MSAGYGALSAAEEARDVERAERIAAARLGCLGAVLRMAHDGGFIVTREGVVRRCGDACQLVHYVNELEGLAS